ncbi:MAG: S8 family serine peptidase, partial [Ilumatobacteraceae bacterium]
MSTNTRHPMVVVAGLLAGLVVFSGTTPVAADVAPPDSPSSGTARYVVELEAGAIAIEVKPDHPNVDEIARDAVAESVVADVEARGDALVYDYGDLPFVAVETDDPEALASIPGVRSVVEDIVVERTLSTSLGIVNAQDSDLDGILGGERADGTGWAVAVIDDGIDRTHPFFLRADGTSRVIAEACRTRGACPGGTTSSEGLGSAAHLAGDYHGTHVAGIAAGDSRGTNSIVPRGVARSADIVAVQVFNDGGGAYGIDIDAGLQWVLAQKNAGTAIASVNMSLGGGLFSGACDSYRPSTKAIIDQLNSAGVLVVVAAGNNGSTDAMSWPGCLSNVIPVGSTDDNDSISSYSNIAAGVADLGLVAPGRGICSSVARTVLSSGYGCISGTSMSAPHVAGAVALLRQASPAASLADITAALRTTPTSVTDTRGATPRAGLRRLDVSSALGYFATPGGVLAGTITDDTESPGSALSTTDVDVYLTPTGALNGRSAVATTVTTDSNGDFTLANVLVGDWSATVSASSFVESAPVAFTITNGQTTSKTFSVAAQTGDISGSISGVTLPASVDFSLTPAEGSRWSARTLSQSVGGDGQFSISGVRIGDWALNVESGGAVSASIDVTVTSNATTSAGVVTLTEPTGSLAGTATHALTSASLANTPLTVVGTPVGVPSNRSELTATVTTDGQGDFVIPLVRIGAWDVTVSASNFEARGSSVTITAGQSSTISADLTPESGAVGGSVIDGGLEASSVAPASELVEGVVNFDFDPAGAVAGRVATTRTAGFASAGGAYTVFGILPGDWDVTARVFGFDPTTSAVTVQSGQTTTDLNFVLARRTAISSVSPSSGSTSGGDTVTINGIHLAGATGVTFGGTAGSIVSIASDGRSLVARTPAKSAGSSTVVVTTSLGSSSETVGFSFVVPVPAPTPSPAPSGGGGGGGGGGAPSPATQQVAQGAGGTASVQVGLAFGTVKLGFSGLGGSGSVTVTPKAGKPSTDAGGIVLPGYWLDITSSVSEFESVEVCAPIETSNLASYGLSVDQLRLFHWENNVRKDVTTRVDAANNRVCGVASSFSPFAVGALKTTRVAGADRYETAAKLSASSFTSGVAVAYVVTGEKFPDALAAGAAAGRSGGPVLLTRLNSLPSVTATELKRLAPKRVIVVGGTAVVSDLVIDAIKSTVGNVPVERVWGQDRFETAAQLSQRTFSGTNGTVYVGSGLGFTEILAGAAAAGRDKAPLLLVPGTGPNAGLPLSVAFELKRLNPSAVVVLGGSGLVGSSIVDSIKKTVPDAAIDQIGGV